MSSLADIQSGNHSDNTHIQLAEGLSDFPAELYAFAETLEILDLSGNQLSSLPEDFGRFAKLRILFLSDNNFCSFPSVLSQCTELSMVGIRGNMISDVPEGAFPPRLRWLILTDNEITKLPRSIGTNVYLQKVMLAGNRLSSLPDEMANCVNIELLRLANNHLTELPEWLVRLPRLSWLAFSANPCSQTEAMQDELEQVHWDELQLVARLGEGASGVISQARCQERGDIALKEFKGDITSDGLPADEMATSIAAGQHKNLVGVLAQLVGHPEKKSGLLLTLIERDFENLAAPPSLQSCTRDVYAETKTFSLSTLLNIVNGIASAACHLHQRKIMHGDLYAHNILVNRAADCLLGDFGAATRYNQQSVKKAALVERIEVRAFGCLLEELLTRLEPGQRSRYTRVIRRIERLQQSCGDACVEKRPGFSQICMELANAGQMLES